MLVKINQDGVFYEKLEMNPKSLGKMDKKELTR